MSSEFEAAGLFHRHQPLRLLERLDLRAHLVGQIKSGALPPEAGAMLTIGDAFDALQTKVSALKESSPVLHSQPGHPILQWLVSHAPQIEQFVQEILSLFGINIHLPPIPVPNPPAPVNPTPSPTPPVVVPPPFNPTPPASSGESLGFVMPAALSTWLQQMILQAAISAVQKVVPEIQSRLPAVEAAIEAWLKEHVGG